MLELANIVRHKTRSAARIIHKPLPTDDPKQRRPDIRRAARVLGWWPKVQFDDGLAEMIGWFSMELHGAKLDDALVS